MPPDNDDLRTNKPHDDADAVVTVHTAGGEDLPLTLNEFRLALLCLVDFDGDWEALHVAAAFVVDGEGKRNLMRERLQPNAAALPVLLERGIDSLDVLAARHWFRHTQL